MFESVQKKRNYFYLVIFDFFTIFSSFLLFYNHRFSTPTLKASAELIHSERFLSIVVIIILFNFVFDLYESRYWVNAMFSPIRIFMAVVASGLTVVTMIYFFSEESKDIIGRGVFVTSMTLYFFLSGTARWWVQRSYIKQVKYANWLFIGDKTYDDEFRNECKKNLFSINYRWIDSSQQGAAKEVEKATRQPQLFRGIIVGGELSKEMTQALIQLRMLGTPIFGFQYFNELVWGKISVKFLNPSWFVFSSGFSIVHKKTMNALKTSGDIMVSLALLAISSPVLFLAILAICLESKGSPIYRQKRVGLRGQTFTIYKLRTMVQDAEKNGAQWAQVGDSRITFIGRFLRFTRIDEIPQLFNILRGEMSFIGPRPERPEFTQKLEEVIPYYDFRHLVKPGLTGWAQVMYRYGASEDDALEKLKFDLFYIKNYSTWLDIIIFFKTFVIVLFGKGR